MSNSGATVRSGSAIRGIEFYSPAENLCVDVSEARFPTRLHGWVGELSLSTAGSFFGFALEGSTRLECSAGRFELGSGMYFSVSAEARLSGGRGLLIENSRFRSLFQIGGPVEARGRLRYIDGCTDTLLIAPPIKGDPCLNLLHIPPGTRQTRHTHPSLRAGIIARGRGVCLTAEGERPLEPGVVFHIPADAEHAFHTRDRDLLVIAYHPDTDFGPTHQNHPMVNRTIVEGVSASKIEAIQTRGESP